MIRIPTMLCAAALLAPLASAQTTPIPLSQIIERMNTTAAQYPSICQVVDLNAKYGTPLTWQGRSILAVKISDNVAVDEDEESVMIVSAHHGNEYGTPFPAIDAMVRLTEGYGVNPEITAIVDSKEIWIAPVWNVDGYPTSRHNRRPGSTVDLNRNYPFLWSSPCNTGVKGPAPGSEPETQTMMAWSEDQRFTKVLDFHSSGRETLYDYRSSCPTHVLRTFLRNEAVALSTASSYGGQVRGPSSNGEHYQWQLGNYSNHAFLTEISNTQSPSFSSATTEANRLWPGTLWYLNRAVPVSGHITDAITGDPVVANISYVENPFTQGERNRSEPLYGRYHAWLPDGNHTLRIEHPCYQSVDVPVTVTATGTVLDIQLSPRCAGCNERNGSGVNPTGFACTDAPIVGATWNTTIATTPSTSATYLALSAASAQTPVLGGEALIDLSTVIFLPGNGSHSVGIPNEAALVGAQAFSQGFRIDASSLVLLNAQDLVLGIAPPL